MVGQVESFAGLDEQRHLLAAGDRKLNLRRRIGSFDPLRQEWLTVGQYDEHAVAFAVGCRIEADRRDQLVPFLVGRECER